MRNSIKEASPIRVNYLLGRILSDLILQSVAMAKGKKQILADLLHGQSTESASDLTTPTALGMSPSDPIVSDCNSDYSV